jgi:hypothetical protein
MISSREAGSFASCQGGAPFHSLLEELEKKGSIKIAAAMYDLATGAVEFVS